MNANISRNRAEKRKYERSGRKSGLTVRREIYKEKRNFVTRLIEASRNEDYSTKNSECQGDQKKLFGVEQGLFDTNGEVNLPTHDNQRQPASDGNFFVGKNKLNDDLRRNNVSNPASFTGLSQIRGEKMCTFRLGYEDEIYNLVLQAPATTCDLDPLPSRLLKNDCSR
ncbi:hypothetical protein HOLleu_10100 [Holothuria leucospilota]|uniref:Uncharacterized protein n=1 Tax=Holothuria leucospilota TaxID=206669 RepID=A0A9Q1HBH0_HOLLE|nr:hypothetical protein HOLleu_10100 [Holothuria leucospilota]